MAEGTGKVALVTGAARGIGRAIALRLAADGHDVAVNDLDSMKGELDAVADEVRSSGVRSASVTADVSDPDSVNGMVESVAGELGSLDIMVANAGIAQVKPLLDVTPEDFDRMMAVNARGVFLCFTAAARRMISQGDGGKIIGACSIAGHKGFSLLGHYSASKFAVRAMTQAAAQEWAEHGITVNSYCPGIVDTAMWELIDEQIGDLQGLEKGQAMSRFSELIALGRVQTPEDVASFVSYLASPDSDYMTGQSVMIDGGIIFS
ncbi:23BDH: acetoin reductase [Rubrobacter radiotolerans]|uniref:diacetyl reductase [(S)-acetoin forming] n=1 Tax=Rubrobacter radiotolerans TaxID=42256 RepID=A0A023X0X7_RUBRA|nr:acetoin reductase [Rubrobacter radiotolerans]AHY45871.1 23BDH: acetoin reductase [Rubrobacter radiotolerans]MDX5893284.1 acetoin reductase [Rubrobacter radiotolerans]SMC03422.1 meso-butanediol dehydrogenase / (S,S)-butanediol dehydrogenase / diacetyl reductase [Rubrobacter radiotolerans DSM 5868]